MNEIQAITTEEELEQMRAMFDEVFEKDVRLDALLFKPHVELKTILSPIDYALDHQKLVALAAAMDVIDDRGLYLSLIEEVQDDSFANHLYIPRENIYNYEDLDIAYHGILENALYSVAGQWGILFTQSEFALIGGPEQFVRTFFDSMGSEPMAEVPEFLKHAKWYIERPGGKLNHLRILLVHLYGEEVAEELLSVHMDNRSS